MNDSLQTRCFFSIDAESDPATASRILQLLTVRGELPDWFSVRKRGADALRIAIEFTGMDETAAHFLAEKIGKLPAVLDVSRSWLSQRDAVKP